MSGRPKLCDVYLMYTTWFGWLGRGVLREARLGCIETMTVTVETQGCYRVLHFSLSVSGGEEYQNCLVLETI